MGLRSGSKAVELTLGEQLLELPNRQRLLVAHLDELEFLGADFAPLGSLHRFDFHTRLSGRGSCGGSARFVMVGLHFHKWVAIDYAAGV